MANSGFFTREMLLSVQTPANAVLELMQFLTGSGFSNVTDWTEGTFQNALLQLAAYLYVQGQQRAATMVLNGVEATASGSFLDAISNSFFNNYRYLGSPTIGNMVVTCSVGTGPYSFGPGQFQVTALGQFIYQNQFSLVLNSSMPVTAAFVATQNGSDWNVPANVPVVSTVSIPGVAVFNPPVPGSTTWVTNIGSDVMTDQALHQINQTKWATLATVETPPDRILNLIFSTSQGAITDVSVDTSNPFGPGTLIAYCSFPQSPASAGEILAVTPAVQLAVFNGANLVKVTAASAVPFGSNGTNNPLQVWYAPGIDLPTLSASLASTLNAWVASVPTGGNDYAGSLLTPGANGIADVDLLVSMLYQVAGVRKVKISNQQDIELTKNQKLTAPVVDPNTFNGMWPGVCGTIALQPGALAFGPQNNVTASIF